jgi:hypothetical protein
VEENIKEVGFHIWLHIIDRGNDNEKILRQSILKMIVKHFLLFLLVTKVSTVKDGIECIIYMSKLDRFPDIKEDISKFYRDKVVYS